MNVSKNIKITSSEKAFHIDVFESANTDEWLVFCHGIKGAKDWGAWHAMAEYLANKTGLSVVTMNFAYNGIGLRGTSNFTEPEAFGHNNYSREISDVQQVLAYLKGTYHAAAFHLMGHSRGGGLVLIYAALHQSIKSVVGLAAVRRLDYAWLEPGFVEKWRVEGVYKVYNSREKINLPVYYQMYEDFDKNQNRFFIDEVADNLKNIPILLVHGTKDEAVSIEQARALDAILPNSNLVEIEGANHTFEISHPWQQKEFSVSFQKALDKIVPFLIANK